MKTLLLPLVLLTGHAMACPDDAGKNAMAPTNGKVVATAPAAPSAKVAAVAPAAKAATKVAARPAIEPRKTTSL
jgi:hypothetical protein